MEKKLLFLDCDPGVDDAVAILLACAAPEVELVGVSAVGGNVPLKYTLRNALDLVAFAGCAHVPVYPGAHHPLTGEALDAASFHGANGLAGATLPESPVPAQTQQAWDALYREAAARPGALTAVLTGPCTNAAIAFTRWPDLPGLLKEVVVMGGASAFGNTTPAAEFNFLADPEAAEIVLQSGANVTLCPLDVTHKALLLPQELDAMAALGSPQAAFAAQVNGGPRLEMCMEVYRVPGAPMHDPCAMLWAIRPHLFQSVRCWAAVETGGIHCRGKLVTDAFSDAKREANCTLVLEVDRPAFAQAMLELMGRY